MSNNKTEGLSILDSGVMSQVYSYRVKVDGKTQLVFETFSLDTQNGTYGTSLGVTTGIVGPNQEISPDSALGKAILEDADGTRGNAYRNKMDFIESRADKQTLANSTTHENALRESGMYDVARGFTSHTGTTFPDKNANVEENIGDGNDSKPEEKKYRSNASTGSWQYPSDMNLHQDYIYFEKFEYKPPQQDYLSKTKKVEETVPVGGDTYWGLGAATWNKTKTVTKVISEPSKVSAASVINKGLSKGSNLGKTLLGSVKLPIPNRLSVSSGVNWGEGRVNSLEAGAFLGVQGGLSKLISGETNLGGAIANGTKGALDIFKEISTAGSGQSGTLLSSTLARVALSQLNINVDPGQMIARSTGRAINPNLELLFSGPKLRTFTFVFEFAPNDTKEAKDVRLIQRLFREGMLPTNSTGGERIFLGSPDVFRISYRNNGKRIKSMNIFKICALTAVEMDFTPEGVYQSYEDGDSVSMPVRSNMSLTFTELAPIFANDYDPETKDASVSDLGLLLQGENAITDDDIGF